MALITWMSLIFSGIAAFYAAITHRPLMNNGATWYYMIFTNGSTRDPQYSRYFTLVLEWPATFLLKFYPNIDMKIILATLDYTFAFHSLFSLFICHLILKKKDRLELMIFPLLSYATATISTFAFAVGIVPESLSLFWPLLFLLCFRDVDSWKENVWCVILMISLMVTYEMSAIFFGLLFFVQALRLKNSRATSDITFLVFAIVGASYCVYRVFGPTAGTSDYFWKSIKEPLDPFRIFVSISILGFFLLIWSVRKFPRTYLPTFIFAVSAIGMGYFLNTFFTIYVGSANAYISRVTAIPIAGVIAFGYIVLNYYSVDSKKIKRLLTGLPLLFVGFVMTVSTIYDLKVTHNWDTNNQIFLRNHIDSKGCIRSQGPFGVQMGWAAPFLTILLQESRKIDWVAFGIKSDPNSCKNFAEGYINDGAANQRIDHHWYFDFSTAIAEARKTEGI